MPLFEYACQSCQKEFEWLSRGSDAPECPSCHGKELQRRHSTFAARASGAASGATQVAPHAQTGACGSCGDPRGPGSCSMN